MNLRMGKLTELARNKAVLHIGFADAQTYPIKIERGLWLHGLLVDVAKLCVGVDTDKKAVKDLKATGIKYLYTNMNDVIGLKFDFILLGETLEHVDNPVLFLKVIKKKFPGTPLVLTVPNAFRIRNFTNALRGKEAINTDHRYWFTPFTIQKVLTQAGYEIKDIEMVESYQRVLSKRLFITKFHYFRDTILIRTT